MFYFFFFNDTATTEIYTLSLHDALPISSPATARTCSPWRIPLPMPASWWWRSICRCTASPSSPIPCTPPAPIRCTRSEEHTSELQSQSNLVCRLLLEKKKKRDEMQLVLHGVEPQVCDGSVSSLSQRAHG